MRNEIVIVCFQALTAFACNENSNADRSQKKTEVAVSQEPKAQEEGISWREYKRVTALNKDTLPYRDCFVVIAGNKMTYKREGKVMYTDSIFLDKKYVAKTYRFKKNTADVMIITGENDKELVLKRGNYDGDYEYFRKE